MWSQSLIGAHFSPTLFSSLTIYFLTDFSQVAFSYESIFSESLFSHCFSILFTPVFLNCFHIVYHINCHWFSSNCFLTGFNHLLYFLITRSIKILIRAPGQVLVKPKIIVNRRSLYPPTILKVCLFLEISTTLMNLILKLYSKAVADWRLLQVIQRNLMNLKKSL